MLVFWSFAVAGILSLLVATIYLIVMNWNEDMYPRLISALGAGGFTLLVAVLTALKGSHEESKFTTTVLFDATTGRPPLLRPAPGNLPSDTAQWTNDLAVLAAGIPATPKTQDDVFAYVGELLQFRLLSDLRALQREGTGVTTTVGSPLPGIKPGSIRVRLPDQVELTLNDIRGTASNRFFGTQHASFLFNEMPKLRVPRGTAVEIALANLPRKYFITFSRRGFFKFVVTAEPIMGAPSSLPPGTMLLREDTPCDLTAYVLDVTMTADFEKLTAGNWRTAYYKRWVAWLMAELPRRSVPGQE